jgi:hypothetical protein
MTSETALGKKLACGHESGSCTDQMKYQNFKMTDKICKPDRKSGNYSRFKDSRHTYGAATQFNAFCRIEFISPLTRLKSSKIRLNDFRASIKH